MAKLPARRAIGLLTEQGDLDKPLYVGGIDVIFSWLSCLPS